MLGGIQTPDLQDRNLLLYSAELRAHTNIKGGIVSKYSLIFVLVFLPYNVGFILQKKVGDVYARYQGA